MGDITTSNTNVTLFMCVLDLQEDDDLDEICESCFEMLNTPSHVNLLLQPIESRYATGISFSSWVIINRYFVGTR